MGFELPKSLIEKGVHFASEEEAKELVAINPDYDYSDEPEHDQTSHVAKSESGLDS